MVTCERLDVTWDLQSVWCCWLQVALCRVLQLTAPVHLSVPAGVQIAVADRHGTNELASFAVKIHVRFENSMHSVPKLRFNILALSAAMNFV